MVAGANEARLFNSRSFEHSLIRQTVLSRTGFPIPAVGMKILPSLSQICQKQSRPLRVQAARR